MSKNKNIDIFNIEIEPEDILIMEKFVELYEDCKEKFEECQEQYSGFEYQKVELRKMEILNQLATNPNNQSILNEYKKIDKKQKELNNYQDIIKIYNEIYAGNLKKYFQQEFMRKNNLTIEKFTENTPIYKKYLKVNKKAQQCTITQIYRNVKYLLDLYKKIYSFNYEVSQTRGVKGLIKRKFKKLELKREIKQSQIKYLEKNLISIESEKANTFLDISDIKNSIEFFNTFKNPIEYFNKDYEIRIKQACRKTEQIPEEIILTNGVIIESKTAKKPTNEEIIATLIEYREQLTNSEPENTHVKTA